MHCRFAHHLVAFLALSLLSSIAFSQPYPQPELEIPTIRVGTSGQFSAVFVQRIYQQATHESFNNEDYETAFDGYHLLARFNDKIAQYRLAFMYAHGLGVEKDLIEAYAWSRLSRNSLPMDYDEFQEIYVNLSEYIAEQLNTDEIIQGKSLASNYLSRYGAFALAIKARVQIYKDKAKCTGTRTGGGCHLVESAPAGGFNTDTGQEPSSNGVCNLHTDPEPSYKCLLYASVGLPGVVGAEYQQIGQVIDNIDAVIQRYNPGRVELRELEIDDSAIIERS